MKLVPLMATYKKMKWTDWWTISEAEVAAIRKLQVPDRELKRVISKIDELHFQEYSRVLYRFNYE